MPTIRRSRATTWGAGRWALVGTSLPVSVPGEPPASGQDGRVLVAGNFDFSVVDLRGEEGVDGGHTIARHVGKTDAYLLARVRGEVAAGNTETFPLPRAGTFSTLQTANDFVNWTLQRNKFVVEQVAIGFRRKAFLESQFIEPTGWEYYRSSRAGSVEFRETTGVGVLIIHMPKSMRGFRVHTAYPLNKD